MTSVLEAARNHCFPGWELRPDERLLLVRGEPAKIGNRAFDLLSTLVESRGRAVSKEALMQAAWPGLVVEDNNLTVQMAGLRKLLGPQAIATVAGFGYRLALPSESAGEAHRAQPAAVPSDALIGRETDLRALVGQAGTTPLVSIVGTGGVGKSSLLRVLVTQWPRPVRDGVHWIDLAPLRDGAQVASVVAKSLGIELDSFAHAQEDLIAGLSHSSAVVVLDNCEHVLSDVAALVGHALQAAPGLQWLVGSQWPLRVPGERVYRLDPLAMPPADSSAEEALRHGAVEFLCRRASAADRHFVIDASTVGAVIDICRQLDGLPLALELAASRVATLGLATVRAQLGQRLRFLAGPHRGVAHHHSLSSTLDWSHSLLGAAEQRVFRRLEPFAGSFSALLAQRMSDEGDGIDVLDVLSSLVDKSLVQRLPGEAARFFLLGSAREYAASKLAAAGETELLRRRHAEVLADWFEAVKAGQTQLREDHWIAKCSPERDNVRAALAWAAGADDAALLARLIVAAAQIDAMSHRVAELARWCMPLEVLMAASPPLRAAACLELSWAHYADGSRETGTELAHRALDDYRALGDAVGTYRALAQLIRLYESRPGLLPQALALWQELQGIDTALIPLRARLSASIAAGFFYERDRSIERLQELEALAQRAGSETLVAVCRAHITDQMLVERAFERAAATARRFIDEGMPPSRARSLVLINLTTALIQLGLVREAREPARAALRTLPSAVYVVVDAFALAAAREGRFVDAALMAGYGTRVRRERDEQADPPEASMIDETSAALAAALPADRLSDLLIAGAALSTIEALALAGLGEPGDDGP
jgi:predicted ATPase/DNA-binding winged helix-turn-helix (wHTH) protein